MTTTVTPSVYVIVCGNMTFLIFQWISYFPQRTNPYMSTAARTHVCFVQIVNSDIHARGLSYQTSKRKKEENKALRHTRLIILKIEQCCENIWFSFLFICTQLAHSSLVSQVREHIV